MCKNKPGLHAGEKSIRVDLPVPCAVFTEPELGASVQLEGAPATDHRIELVTAVRDALDAIPHIHVSVPPVQAGDDE